MFYVGEMREDPRCKPWCHLVSSVENTGKLHEFIKYLGLIWEDFQYSETFPHYNLTAKQRALALKIGAEVVLDEQLKNLI